MTIQEQICKRLPTVIKPSAKKWLGKELVKANIATKFIGLGAFNSSTDRYMILYDEYSLANVNTYTADDIVWVSSNGRRFNRVRAIVDGALAGPYILINKVIEAGATIIMDTQAHIKKTSYYNVGELALFTYLISKTNYTHNTLGVWTPRN